MQISRHVDTKGRTSHSEIGIGLGLLIGVLASVALAFATGFPAAPSPISLVGALLVPIIVGVLSGYLPARRAARMNPVDPLTTQ